MNPSGGRSASTPEDEQRTSIQAIVLIVAAVVIGVLLLWLGFDQEGGVVDTASGPQTTTTEASTATAPPAIETTTTEVPPSTNPPASVSIIVANGSGGSGQAGEAQTELVAKGFTQVETANAPLTDTSTVYFAEGAEGAEGDAAAVAEALGIATEPEAVPASPPVPLNGATVLVVIGSDQL